MQSAGAGNLLRSAEGHAMTGYEYEYNSLNEGPFFRSAIYSTAPLEKGPHKKDKPQNLENCP